MKIRNICIPCALDFAYRTLKFIGFENNVEIMREILKSISSVDYKLTPAHLGTMISRTIKKMTGIEDPYKEEKLKQNELGKRLYKILKNIINESEERIVDAIKISCVGNSIDLGATGVINIDFERIKKELNFELNVKRLKEFLKRLEESKSIFFISDNAGEIMFDKVFLEEIKNKKIFVSVKTKPIINDITIAEIWETGIQDFAEIIETGTDSIGIMLEEVTEEFKKIFFSADMIIAKGHGNFETLIDSEREVFFLLKAKCDYVAETLGVEKYSYYIGNNRI